MDALRDLKNERHKYAALQNLERQPGNTTVAFNKQIYGKNKKIVIAHIAGQPKHRQELKQLQE